MGIIGRSMLTVKNNKNLLKKRSSLFDLEINVKEKASKKDINQTISLYEKDQIIKRRNNTIKSYRKNILWKNIIAAVLLLIVLTLILLIKP